MLKSKLDNVNADHLLHLCIHHGIGVEVNRRRDGVLVFRAYSVCRSKFSLWTEKDIQGAIRQVLIQILETPIDTHI